MGKLAACAEAASHEDQVDYVDCSVVVEVGCSVVACRAQGLSESGAYGRQVHDVDLAIPADITFEALGEGCNGNIVVKGNVFFRHGSYASLDLIGCPRQGACVPVESDFEVYLAAG